MVNGSYGAVVAVVVIDVAVIAVAVVADGAVDIVLVIITRMLNMLTNSVFAALNGAMILYSY